MHGVGLGVCVSGAAPSEIASDGMLTLISSAHIIFIVWSSIPILEHSTRCDCDSMRLTKLGKHRANCAPTGLMPTTSRACAATHARGTAPPHGHAKRGVPEWPRVPHRWLEVEL